MNPVAESSEMKFSQCTLGNICKCHLLKFTCCVPHNPSSGSLMQPGAASGTHTTCLIDATDAQSTISLQMCGNGIVEAGEQCDPGQGVNSTCCDSATCKFTAGAVCDPASSSCCTSQCAFAPSSQVCRPAKDPNCDQAEMCTGTSAACPADITAPNGKVKLPFVRKLLELIIFVGKSCGSNGLACASGVCTSLSRK